MPPFDRAHATSYIDVLSQAERQRCKVVRPTCRVNRKRRILTPITSKTLKFVKFELDFRDYVPEIDTSANFHFHPFQTGEILRFCDFFPGWLYCIFSRSRAQVEPVDGFSRLIRRVFTQGRSFWRLRQHRNLFGVYPPNLPKRCANRQFQAKPVEYKYRDILQSMDTINVQF